MAYMTIQNVNELTEERFVNIFGNVIEQWDNAAKFVASKRPFENFYCLLNAFYKYLDSSTSKIKQNILEKHPDIGAKDSMTEESIMEQKSIGISRLTVDEMKKLNAFNIIYRTLFGFPFVICARQNHARTILNEMCRRLINSRSEEILVGIEEVKKILKLRLKDIVII